MVGLKSPVWAVLLGGTLVRDPIASTLLRVETELSRDISSIEEFVWHPVSTHSEGQGQEMRNQPLEDYLPSLLAHMYKHFPDPELDADEDTKTTSTAT